MTNQTNNKSFILHNDSLEILDKLDDAQAGKLFKAIKFYQKHKQLPQLDFTLDLVFTPFLNQFKRDEEKYQNIVERNKINGSKGGRPKNPVGYLETQENPRKPKKAYSDSKNKNKNKNIPPSIDDIRDYCNERMNNIDPQRFFDFYQSKGWLVGKSKMKDWKAALRNWENNNRQELKPIKKSVFDIE